MLFVPPSARADDFADLPPVDELPLPGFDAPLPPDPESAPAGGASAVSEVPATPRPDTADEVFDLRAKAIEEQVNDLKEKVFRTKARLMALSEAVLGDRPSGAKLVLHHRNELGSSYVLVSATYTFNGAPLFNRSDESGELNEREEFVVYDQRVPPGEHQINVQYKLRGHGFGVFSYLEGMRLSLTNSFTFTVEPGKVTTVNAIIHEKSGLTLEFKDKPSIRFETNVQKEVSPRNPVPQASAGGAAP